MAATSLGAAGRGLRVAQAGDLPALQHQQQLPLQIQIQVGDLVEEQRAAVRLLEHAGVILDRAGVGARAARRTGAPAAASAGMVDRSVTTSGPLAPERGWMACSARKLLPVPVSPSISTGSGERASTPIDRRSSAIAGLRAPEHAALALALRPAPAPG